MKLGMFMMPLHHPDRDYATVLQEDREAIILADQLGYDEVWVGEHCTSKAEQITSPLVFLASLIDRTKNIRLGTGVLNLPQAHPARMAGEVAMLDQLSGGRVLLGIGPGGLPSDFELFGRTDAEARPRMMLESIDMMLKIWTTDPPYALDGEFWDVRVTEASWPELGVGHMAQPFQKPHPPVAMSVMSPFSGSAKTAGERGWIPISANFVPANNVASHWQAYAKGATAAGQPTDGSIWRVARSIVVTETDAEAEDYVQKANGVFQFYFHYLLTLLKSAGAVVLFKPDFDMPDDAVTVESAIETMVIAGSADTVLDKLVAFRDTVGPFGTLLMAGHDWDDKALWRGSMERLARDVMPRLSQHSASREAAE